MLQVYIKEMLELTRDKKTLIFTILLPTLIMPVILGGFFTLSLKIAKKANEEVLDFAIIGSQNYAQVESELLREPEGDEDPLNFNLITLEPGADVDELINTNKIRFALVIPDGASQAMENGETLEIDFKYNDSATTSGLMFKRVNDALEDLKTIELVKRYAKLGLTEEQGEALGKPLKLVQKSTANERESFGEKFGAFLPYILILVGLSGAMYPAIDLGVGEKDRGTLETLLLTPVSRFSLVLAKFLVIFTTSFLAIFLSLLSFAIMTLMFGPYFSSMMGPESSANATSVLQALTNISVVDILLMFSMLVPIAAIFASLLLSVSIYARTFKEAQNYMSPIMFLVFLPLILALLPGVKLDWVWASVPITNVALAIKEIFKGTIDMGMLAVIFLSTTIIAGVLLALCNWWFQREQVLFRN
ncbi:ABC transporter permease [Aliikangiella marina]|uniref:ABC transporter permease n=1 Tax=Aliikangiella marina TaxID=1712262 RepID=A0A545TE17_9GAMM|nr:ABC transporter permease [Aliikangiella marina]TQV75450.1 ABC transporter permease [Aliikangiella marina]